MEDFLKGLDPLVVYGVISIIGVILIICFCSIVSEYVLSQKKRAEQISDVISPKKGTDAIVKEEKGKKKKIIGARGLKDAFEKLQPVVLYKQYIFFGGTGPKFAAIFGIGYLAFFLVYYIISKSVVIGILLSLMYLTAVYLILSGKLKKKRIAYLSSFVSSIDTMSASFSAGNSFEEAISTVAERTNIVPKLRSEFATFSNDMRSGMALGQAINKFVKRNDIFEEFTLFGIAIEFYDKSGGRSLGNILDSLKASLSQKISNYAEIESKISSYEKMFNIFIILIIVASLGVTLFMPSFYVTVASTTANILKLAGGIAIALFSTIMFEKIIREAAEG